MLCSKTRRESRSKLIGSILIIMVVSTLLTGCGEKKKYNDALAMAENGDYEGAITAFEEIKEYEDATEQIKECKYQIADKLLKDDKYNEASEAFLEIASYKDAEERSKECIYENADNELSNKNFDKAIDLFESIKDYSDSNNRVDNCKYLKAVDCFEKQDFEQALNVFKEISSYEDSSEYVAKCEYELSVDGKFMRALAEALTARWDYSDSDDAATASEKELYQTASRIEIEKLEEFYDQEFNSKELQDAARDYIDTLKASNDAVKHISVDYTRFMNAWSGAYEHRTILLKQFVNEYGLTVDEKHQGTINDLLLSAESAEEKVEIDKQVKGILDTIQITSSTDEWGITKYNCTIENTSDYTFDYFWVEINVEDDNDTIISTGDINLPDNWAPGKKVSTEIYFRDDINLDEVKMEYLATYQTGDIYSNQ